MTERDMTTLQDILDAMPPERRKRIEDRAAEILAREYRRKLRRQRVRPAAAGGKERPEPAPGRG
jgi:hypothetical protein